MNLVEVTAAYRNAGLCVLPAIAKEKRPALRSWKQYQARLPTKEESDRWFSNTDAVCLICGAVSGNLEMLDFDLAGEAFESWWNAIQSASPELLDRLVVEQSPSGGWHVVYRYESAVSGNLKLAQRKQIVDGPEEVTIAGKNYRPRKDAEGKWHVLLTLIETRGEGGLFLCAPSPRYELFQGDFTNLPILTEPEREVLLEAAWALNQCLPEPAAPSAASMPGADGRPGDDFNERGDVREILRRHGWTLAQGGENEYWRRPGKTSGWSATLKQGVFYVFSNSADPFEEKHAYAPFSVYALLEHGGDFVAAASALRSQGYGDDPPPATDVDLSKILGSLSLDAEPNASEGRPADPGHIPEELMRVPGFVSEVMDFSLHATRYPSLPLAFCGAMALQSFLCSRKVREEGGLRPNLYMLALADSGTGKGYPRKVNSHVLGKLGFGGAVGNQMASGQGLEDEILSHRKMLYQTDEVDYLLRCLSSSKESYHSALLTNLLQLYSAADELYTARSKAKGKGQANVPRGEVDQPGLVIFGTATPECFFDAMSPRLLTNGLFSRAIVIDAGQRGKKQRSYDVSQLPAHIMEVAHWWKNYNPAAVHPHTGLKPDLDDVHPTPAIVPFTDGGYALLDQFASLADDEYDAAMAAQDRVGATLWTRAYENATRLALVYACSREHEKPCIDEQVAQWASRFVEHLVRRMLFLASNHVAENPFHAECLKIVQKLREAPGRRLVHSKLLKRTKFDAKHFHDLIETLVQRGDVERTPVSTTGRAGLCYQLI